MILVIPLLAIAETAWALVCAEASLNLVLFYVVLVAASAVFFVPGVAEMGSDIPQTAPARTPETDR